MSTSENRRAVKAKLIDPKAQVRYFGVFNIVWLGVSILILLGAGWFAQQGMMELLLSSSIPGDLVEAILSLSMRAFYVAAICVVGSGVVAFAHSVLHSHRVYGPLVPLRRMIMRLREGDYTARVKFRKGDELMEIMEIVNALAEELERKHGSTDLQAEDPTN